MGNYILVQRLEKSKNVRRWKSGAVYQPLLRHESVSMGRDIGS